MTPTEFKKLISKTQNFEWFNSVEFKIEYPILGLYLEFKGFPTLFKYANEQVKGWEKIDDLPNDLQNSKAYYEFTNKSLIEFVENYGQVPDSNDLNNYFSGSKYQIQEGAHGNVFEYGNAIVDFLVEINNNHPVNFGGAYAYITKNLGSYPINQNDFFDGCMLAYEFLHKEESLIVERKNKERASLSKLTNDFKNSLPELERELTDHLKNNDDLVKEQSESIEQFKVDKEKLYSDWFINAKGEFETFSKDSNSKLVELENVYKEKLKLEEPARYWSNRARKLKKQGWIALTILVLLVLVIVISLGELLWNTPTQIYNSFFDGDKSAAIRWSIIYVTFISFMAFCIKAVSKVMFSSFHLARDSEERHTLTYFYLSLLKDSSIAESERQLIMQSLFSRAETGLLKDDSSPTMPNDIVGKLFNK